MNRLGWRCFGGFLTIALIYLVASGTSQQIASGSNEHENQEYEEWVATCKSWINRQLCKWVGLCGLNHLNSEDWVWDGAQDHLPTPLPDYDDWWTSGTEDSSLWSDKEKSLREIPQYVFDYAPYVHLFSEEQFWPCDIAEHLVHISPYINYTEISDLEYDRNLTNLNELNDYDGAKHGRAMYLQSKDNVEERPRPKWLGGAENIPNLPKKNRQPDDEDATWSDLDDQTLLDSQSESEHFSVFGAPTFRDSSTEDFEDDLPDLIASTNGRCGGTTGFTCKGSKFGRCCSIYGWCGNGDSYCDLDACAPVAGKCNDPYQPSPKPHLDLRKRTLDLGTTKHKSKDQVGRSTAPAILVVVPKEDGIVDAFWFFFYSFNLGQTVMNIRFGNHVGDWEHTLIRFKDGEPDTVFLSEHNFGDAYAWHALEKYLPSKDGSGSMIGTWTNATAAKKAKRPVVYSAEGSHAMYATPGLHPYILPWGMLHDQTDRGPLWDPSLNVQSYTFDHEEKTLRASNLNPKAPTEWFHFAGHWGDKFYKLSDKRQYRFAGQYHYVNGPTGPKFKNLARQKVCQSKGSCRIRHWADGSRARRVPLWEDEEEGGLPGGNSTEDSVL